MLCSVTYEIVPLHIFKVLEIIQKNSSELFTTKEQGLKREDKLLVGFVYSSDSPAASVELANLCQECLTLV